MRNTQTDCYKFNKRLIDLTRQSLSEDDWFWQKILYHYAVLSNHCSLRGLRSPHPLHILTLNEHLYHLRVEAVV